MKKIIVIVGPTSSGKSKIAISIAKKFDCEIINSDCFQVYKELNIGTNKPKINEMQGIKHHLIDFISINDDWDIKKFKELSEEIIDKSTKTIIVTGGSNLYIDALINNYDLSNKKRTNEFSGLTNEELYSKLCEINEKLATKIGISNRKRLERALENNGVMEIKNKIKYQPYIVFINPERETLYNKINNRVDEMINEGLLEEVKKISENKNLNALKAIGYKEIISNNFILDENVINLIKKNTRNYAKRQLTWCRNKYNSNLIISNDDNLENLFNKIEVFLNE